VPRRDPDAGKPHKITTNPEIVRVKGANPCLNLFQSLTPNALL
jgi:hypothetical protein